jgi:hypothetical protein
MTAETIFKIVQAGAGLFTYGLAVLLFSLPWPRRALLRGLLAIAAAWVVGIFYTALVYNPAGIAAGHEAGAHFPENSYDNNTISVAIIGGWIGPAILIGLMGAFRAMREDVGLRSEERTPNTSCMDSSCK